MGKKKKKKTCLPGEDRDKLWHHHNHNTATETVSGVYYLHLPDDVTSYETAGTELAPNGVEGEGKFITPMENRTLDDLSRKDLAPSWYTTIN